MTYENPSNKRHAADLSRRANHRVTRPTVSIQAVPLHTNQLAYGCSFPRLTGFTSDQVERGPDFNNRRTGSAGITVSPPRKTSRGGRCNHRKKGGGEGGIRTLDTVRHGIHDFQSCAFSQLSHLSTMGRNQVIGTLWRRGRDSNPRGALTPTRFRIERIQPGSATSPRSKKNLQLF